MDVTGAGSWRNAIGILINGALNTVGGTVVEQGNIISGNGWGVRLSGTNAFNNAIWGNWIGLGRWGDPVPNEQNGVQLIQGARDNLIGGGGYGPYNIISANLAEGVSVGDTDSSGNMIQGNWIGTDANGTAAMGNGSHGIMIYNAPGSIIGGSGAGEDNVIAANNGNGVVLSGLGCRNTWMRGTRIGLAAAGEGALGNAGAGVWISDSPSNTIGTSWSGDANTIAHNGNRGILVFSDLAVGNQIGINRIYDNVGLGIDLGADGVTPNDPLDADLGPNRRQNFPVLTSVSNDGSRLIIAGMLSAATGTHHLINLYGNWNCDASGYGEGETYLGQATADTDAAGMAWFTNDYPLPSPLPNFITATAVDVVQRNTSEFSPYLMLDSDRDGMPDGFEERYFGSATGGDPAGHADADGSSNLDEFVADTDPTDADSRPPEAQIRRSGAGFMIGIPTSVSRRYVLGDSQELATPSVWNERMGSLAGTGGLLESYWNLNEDVSFFRYRVRLP